MQHTLLISNEFALEECARLQPNSRSWRNETGTLPVGGFTPARIDSLLASRFMRGTMGVVRLSDSPALESRYVAGGPAYTGRTGILVQNPFAFDGKLGFAVTGGIMPEETRPATLEMQISNYKNGNSGLISTFNNLDTGSHSRPGGLPPLPDASAPPGRASADPGGGPTAS
jgi:hypothetical protein